MLKLNKTDRWEYTIYQLDAIRKEKDITHYHISKLMNLQQPNIANFFSAKNRPNLEFVKKIAKILKAEIIVKELTGEVDMTKVNKIALEKIDQLIIKEKSDLIDDILS